MIPDYAMPVSGLFGGLMIGISAGLMLILLGRIAGVSGLFARTLGLAVSGPPVPLAAMFIIGLALGALAISVFVAPVPTRYPHQIWTLIIGGLLVGFGTRLGSGCTSGHGVCGVSRLSRRSILATIVFIGSGMITVSAMNALEVAW